MLIQSMENWCFVIQEISNAYTEKKGESFKVFFFFFSQGSFSW